MFKEREKDEKATHKKSNFCPLVLSCSTEAELDIMSCKPF